MTFAESTESFPHTVGIESPDFTSADLERIAGPAGLDIGAESPAETALSMLAEILAVRAGRSGGRLKEGKTRIHVSL